MSLSVLLFAIAMVLMASDRLHDSHGHQAGDAVANCSVSIGIAVSNRAGDTVDILLARVETALYLAKANGRNRTEFALEAVS